MTDKNMNNVKKRKPKLKEQIGTMIFHLDKAREVFKDGFDKVDCSDTRYVETTQLSVLETISEIEVQIRVLKILMK